MNKMRLLRLFPIACLNGLSDFLTFFMIRPLRLLGMIFLHYGEGWDLEREKVRGREEMITPPRSR